MPFNGQQSTQTTITNICSVTSTIATTTATIAVTTNNQALDQLMDEPGVTITPHTVTTQLGTATVVTRPFVPRESTFYLDMADTTLVPRIVRYICHHGGHVATFFDRSVTHLITDKAISHVENYKRAQAWSITIWNLEVFSNQMLQYVQATNGIAAGSHAKVLASLKTAGSGASKKRDLTSYLAEERRASQQTRTAVQGSGLFHGVNSNIGALGSPRVGRGGPWSATTIAAAVRIIENAFYQYGPGAQRTEENNNLTGGAEGGQSQANSQTPRASFHEFTHPFVMFTESSGLYAPVYKEYAPATGTSNPGTASVNSHTSVQPGVIPRYPVFYTVNLGKRSQACPFLPPPPPKPPKATPLTKKEDTAVPIKEEPHTHAINNTVTGGGIMTRSKAAKILQQQQKSIDDPCHIAPPEAKQARLDPDQDKENLLDHAIAHQLQQDSVSVDNTSEPVLDDEEEEIVQTTTLVNPLLNNKLPQVVVAAKPTENTRFVSKPRPRPGYCECCYEKYNELEKHVRTMLHRQYALEDSNYRGVDDLLQYMKRPLLLPPWELPPPTTLGQPHMPSTHTKSSGKKRAGVHRLPPRSPLSPISNNSNIVNAASTVSALSVVAGLAGTIHEADKENRPPQTEDVLQLQQLPPVNPDLTRGSKNYTSAKKHKQNEAIKNLNLMTSLGPATEDEQQFCPSSPSLKRRKSARPLVPDINVTQGNRTKSSLTYQLQQARQK